MREREAEGLGQLTVGRAREGMACACLATRGVVLLLFLASPSTLSCPSQHTMRQRAPAPAPVGGGAATDCSGDEEFARRLQEEEVRAAVAATGRPDACLHMAQMASTRLADEDSRALCYELGDRGFEGTGSTVDGTNGTADGNHSANEFLLGSVGRAILPVLREGVNRIFDLPRTLVTIAELGARCAPIAGVADEDASNGEDQVDGGEGMLAASSGVGPAVDCASDEALARAMQEQEWLEARR